MHTQTFSKSPFIQGIAILLILVGLIAGTLIVRKARVQDLNEFPTYILELPDDAFDGPVDERKSTFLKKFDAAVKQVVGCNYKGTIHKLKYDRSNSA